jgi:hypothetical protein
MLKVEGLMPAKCGMFDTPGVPHPHQLAAYLDPEEVQPLFRFSFPNSALCVQRSGVKSDKGLSGCFGFCCSGDL